MTFSKEDEDKMFGSEIEAQNDRINKELS